MADNNKLFLGTNKDTYIAADDAGNVVIQTERGTRAVIDNEGIKVGVDGADPGSLEPLSYQFSTVLSAQTLPIENPFRTSAAQSQLGYLDFTTQEILPANPGGYFVGGDYNQNIFRETRSNSINITQLWEEFMGRSLTPSDANAAGVWDRSYPGPNTETDFILYSLSGGEPVNADGNYAFSPATFLFDFEQTTLTTQSFNGTLGQGIKGTIALTYAEVNLFGGDAPAGYVWRQRYGQFQNELHPQNTFTISPVGFGGMDALNPGYGQSNIGETISPAGGLPVDVWSPYIVVGHHNHFYGESNDGYSSYKTGGIDEVFKQWEAPISTFAGVTDLEGNLLNTVDFRKMQDAAYPGLPATLHYDLRLSNFRAVDSVIL